MADRGIQGRAAHDTAEAEWWAKSSIRLANGPADDIIAGTMASVGLRLWTTAAIAGIAAAAITQAQVLLGGLPQEIATYWGFGVSGLIATIAAEMIRRPVYLSVTQDELICYRVPKMSQQPAAAKVLFRMQSCAVRVDGRKSKKGRNWTLHVASRSPGTKDRLPQPVINRSWFRELGEVMTALQASGAEVQPALLDTSAPQGRSGRREGGRHTDFWDRDRLRP